MLLFCSSFRRLCLTQATLLRITIRRHLRRSWILFTDKTLPKLSLRHQNRVWGSHLLDSRWSYYMINHLYWSCHMINVWLVSPSEHGFLTLLRDLRRVGGWLFFLMITVWLAPLAEDAEDSFMFSRSFAFAFASSWFVFTWSQSLGRFCTSVLGHSMDDAWVHLLFKSITFPTLSFRIIKTRWRTFSFSR